MHYTIIDVSILCLGVSLQSAFVLLWTWVAGMVLPRLIAPMQKVLKWLLFFCPPFFIIAMVLNWSGVRLGLWTSEAQFDFVTFIISALWVPAVLIPSLIYLQRQTARHT